MLLLVILSIVLLNIVYLTGFFTISILLNVTEAHYFLGYNPRLLKFRIRNTTFNIGFYIPIVGLSPIYTLTDDGQRMKYPWEFKQHSLGRRFIATFGGAIALLITGIIIFIAQTYFTADSIITKEEINRHGIYPSEWAIQSGFLPGDKIVAVNGKDYQEFGDLINPKILSAPEVSYTVIRDGKELQIRVKDMANYLTRRGQFFISLYAPFEIAEVMPGSPADHAGIRPGDRITKVNGQPVIKFEEFANAIRADDDEAITLLVERKMADGSKLLSVDVTPDYEGKLGIRPRELINYTEQKNSLWQAVTKGSYRAFATLRSNIVAFAKVISGHFAPRESLSGPIGIVDVSRMSFWWITGFYALWYSFWNLLPLPKSAFWEMIPLVYEGITKKKYSYSAFKTSLLVSWVVFGGVFVWTLISDIVRLF